MEIKLLQEFDFSDKNSLFGQMDSMNDAIVKDIRESENALHITLHKFDSINGPNGEIIWPYKELEIEYEYAENSRLDILVREDVNVDRWMTLGEFLIWLKKKKAELEMNDWSITSYGALVLRLLAHPQNSVRKVFTIDVEINLFPKKIVYRWKS